MSADRRDQPRALFNRDIECPVCGNVAHSFRILPEKSPGAPAGEFYHRAGVCTGAILSDSPAAATLQRLDSHRTASGRYRISRDNSRSGTAARHV